MDVGQEIWIQLLKRGTYLDKGKAVSINNNQAGYPARIFKGQVPARRLPRG